MKAQILKMRAQQGVGKKTNKPFNGYFTTILYPDRNGEISAKEIFIDKSVLPEALPPDTMIDLKSDFGSTFINEVEILAHEQPFMIRG